MDKPWMRFSHDQRSLHTLSKASRSRSVRFLAVGQIANRCGLCLTCKAGAPVWICFTSITVSSRTRRPGLTLKTLSRNEWQSGASAVALESFRDSATRPLIVPSRMTASPSLAKLVQPTIEGERVAIQRLEVRAFLWREKFGWASEPFDVFKRNLSEVEASMIGAQVRIGVTPRQWIDGTDFQRFDKSKDLAPTALRQLQTFGAKKIASRQDEIFPGVDSGRCFRLFAWMGQPSRRLRSRRCPSSARGRPSSFLRRVPCDGRRERHDTSQNRCRHPEIKADLRTVSILCTPLLRLPTATISQCATGSRFTAANLCERTCRAESLRQSMQTPRTSRRLSRDRLVVFAGGTRSGVTLRRAH